jgi:LuxR family maltose regulon positive regulatory protein
MSNPSLRSPGSRVPIVAGPVLHRSRLLDRLARDDRRITLVSAVPGTGKSTLVADWLRTPDAPRAAWVRARPRDNQPGALVESILSALTGPAGPVDLGPVTVDAERKRLDEALTAFGVTSAAGGVLVIDDAHELVSRVALATLGHVIGRARPGLHVVMISRADPPIPLRRLAKLGAPEVLRAADLAFTDDETVELLRRHEVTLDSDDAATLHRATAGGATSLALAAAALEREPNPAAFIRGLAEADVLVLDHLLRELVDRLDAPARRVLLRAGVVDLLNGELAGLLAEDERAPGILDRFAADGLFVTALSGPGGWFHTQPAIGARLRLEMRRREPQLERTLLTDAARWFRARGLDEEAEVAARRAENWDEVGAVRSTMWRRATTRGRLGNAPEMTDVPGAAIEEVPTLAVLAAAQAVERADRESAFAIRDGIDAARGTYDLEPTTPPVDVCRAVLDVCIGRRFGADARTRRAVRELRNHAALGSEEACAVIAYSLLREGEQVLDSGDLDGGRALLVRVVDAADALGASWARTDAEALVELVDVIRLQHDWRLVLDRPAPITVTGAAVHALAAAAAAVHRGERVRARALVSTIDGDALSVSRPLRVIWRAVVAVLQAPPSVPPRLAREVTEHPVGREVLVALGVSEVTDADGRIGEIGGLFEQQLLRARRALARGSVHDAVNTVEGLLEAQTAVVHPRSWIEALLLAASARHAQGDDAIATRWLQNALDRAESLGLWSPLLAHGQALRELLQSGRLDLGASQRIGMELLAALRDAPERPVVEELTERERAVLAYLPTLMSNAEIATELLLSVNTVKTHLKSVYRKLGVDRRREAVVRARELELL